MAKETVERRLNQEERETTQLISELAVTCNISYATADLIYKTACSLMLTQLASNMKSVDLGWAVLHPMPLRVNWKQIYLSYPQNDPVPMLVRGKSQEDAERILRTYKFYAFMRDTVMLAVRRGIVHFSVELVPKRNWWKFMISEQKQLFSRTGRTGYTKAIATMIHRLEGKIKHAFFSFIAQASLPCGRLRTGSSFGERTQLIDDENRGPITARTIVARSNPVVEPRNPNSLRFDRAYEQVLEQGSPLPKVPDVQSPPEDMRDGDGEE